MISREDYNALILFSYGPVRLENGLSERQEKLKSLGLIQCDRMEWVNDQLCEISWSITVHGEDSLAEFKQRHAEKAKQEKQQRFQNKVSVASVLVPAITFILGLLVENFSGIAGRLLDSLF